MGRQNLFQDWAHGNFPGGPVAKIPSRSAGGLGSIPSQRTKSHMPQLGPGAAKKKIVGPQFSSVAQSCLTLCYPVNRSKPGFPVHHQLLEFIQTYIHWVGDAIPPSHPLSSPSSAFNLSQHQGLFKWVNSSHQVAKILEFQVQHQSLQWTPRTDFL